MRSGSEPFRIEVVCTANICRSPYVHVRLADELDRVSPGGFEVTGSGTLAMEGVPADPGSRAMAREHGLSLRGYRSQRITSAAVTRADLLLVMTSEHRATVIDEWPAARPRTLLLRELARLIEALGRATPWRERLAGRVDGTARSRWSAIVGTVVDTRDRLRGDDDLADPYRRGMGAFVTMAAQADAAISAIVALEAELSAHEWS